MILAQLSSSFSSWKVEARILVFMTAYKTETQTKIVNIVNKDIRVNNQQWSSVKCYNLILSLIITMGHSISMEVLIHNVIKSFNFFILILIFFNSKGSPARINE